MTAERVTLLLTTLALLILIEYGAVQDAFSRVFLRRMRRIPRPGLNVGNAVPALFILRLSC